MFPYILGAGLGTDILPQQAETKTEEPALVAENSPGPTFSNSWSFHLVLARLHYNSSNRP